MLETEMDQDVNNSEHSEGVFVEQKRSFGAAAQRQNNAARGKGAARDGVEQYLGEIQAYKVMDAKQEIAAAERIEELEIAHWNALLSHPTALDTIMAAVESHLGVPKELETLRRLSRAPKRAGSAARWEQGVAQAAARLRALDVARVALFDVDTSVRGALEGQGASDEYLERVSSAREAQQQAKNRFVAANLRLVISLARRYNHGLMSFDDLVQEGNLGLMRAVERFDHRRGFRFSTYASWWIRHALNRALSDRGRLVRVPVHLLDDAQRVARASAELVTLTGEAPTSELVKRTEMTEDKLALVAGLTGGRHTASLDRKLSDDGDSNLLDRIPCPMAAEPESQLDTERWSQHLSRLMSLLSPMEAAILRFRFGLDDGEELTLREIGIKYDLSRERIRQLQEQALQTLRVELARRHEPQALAEAAA